jgi:ribose 5-phosphate isomerase A
MGNAERTRAWHAAGTAAAALVEPGMRVGLGTGRAAAAGIVALGLRVRAGLRCTGVPTSTASAALARREGIVVGRLRGPLDLAFDGADAVDPSGCVVKGAGGAMVRERIVADAAGRFVVLVDGPKLVASLDEWGTLPIAVVPFAAARVVDRLAHLSPSPRDRRSDDGLTLIDLSVPAGASWPALAADLGALPGVVDHGFFEVDPRDVFVGARDGAVTSAGEFSGRDG